MARKFISVLGAGAGKEGKYEECIYTWENNKSFKTEYIQEAIVNLFCDDWVKDDKVVIFTTERSKELHWDKENTLKDRLKQKDFNLENIMIPFGSNSDEQWKLFDTIFNSLDYGDEVIVDITHSFRTIPMFLMIILNYAKLLKDIKVKGIYYGALAANNNKDEIRKAPIFDLTLYNLIMDFTNGITTFLNTGNSNILMNIYNEINLKEKEKEKYSVLSDTISLLNDFSNAVMTCRGNINFLNEKNGCKKSILTAHNEFKKKIEEYKSSENDNLAMALTPLFEKVSDDTKYFEEEDPVRVGIATVRWCIKNGLVQQGITALEETMKVLICVKLGLDYTKYKDRNLAKNLLNVQDKNYKDWKLNNTDKYQVNQLKLKMGKNKIPDDLITLSRNLSKLRNDINHFGLNNKPLESEKIKKNLNKYFNDFIRQAELINWKQYS
ncbi:TIGR02221 family CRISPR-associated protein [Clostridium perfringens]|uniref:TIGR02221 family CRISPR-associated protein n=2 Tax=Clostridium perfringens TaxID=1502 RepID=UPI0024BD4EE6|nr:TIGR02221 family CRISPR-associated protein [Clostridium perfringens]EIL8446955.1 TIGR02221 family CRISPR-associated protein [Clostridium perfringens]ELC8380491.1 TIGR02221 family CRISPR-associated protein [Clostridium perfringens]MDZ5036680.1 TIGR02221 family CRISPR-associated protein [Clostridium perfringens]HEF0382825.1 TIGR02221 family CRISPR-associated protein [Clostridium perfringens]